jgi:glucosamine-6-phosphate deaminase
LSEQGPAYQLNIRIFNQIQHTVSGWPGGKPDADDTYRPERAAPFPKRVLIFSPHPDDDVISMGGILRKFVENGNDVTVAYMTSGNIAVFDHDVRRYVDFLQRLAREGHGSEQAADALASKVHAFFDRKKPGDVDIPEVLDVKRIIREAEAVSGIETVGLPASKARFLNLPFYQTGKVRKDPIGPADVAIVRALLEEVEPDLIFVAGDLSDPHGTHRMCKEAVDQAVAELYGSGGREEQAPDGKGGASSKTATARSAGASSRSAEQAPERSEGASHKTATARSAGARTSGRQSRPEIWLYRGAWQEWPVTEATFLVPMSQEELRLKIQAIFKHQSQKDSAPFPGSDDREFWQRVESRNKDTAATLDRLGLAEYFAMEAYVVE